MSKNAFCVISILGLIESIQKSKMMKDQKDHQKHEEIRERIDLIHKLATRLPWIVMAISLLAFLIIFLQIYLSR